MASTMISVKVSRRLAAALKHWKKCEDCRETYEIAIDDAVTCLSIEFTPIRVRMSVLQEEYAALEAEMSRLVAQPIPKELRGKNWPSTS